jgi:hypothetical protein
MHVWKDTDDESVKLIDSAIKPFFIVHAFDELGMPYGALVLVSMTYRADKEAGTWCWHVCVICRLSGMDTGKYIEIGYVLVGAHLCVMCVAVGGCTVVELPVGTVDNNISGRVDGKCTSWYGSCKAFCVVTTLN